MLQPASCEPWLRLRGKGQHQDRHGQNCSGGSDYERFHRRLLLGSASTRAILRKFHHQNSLLSQIALNRCFTKRYRDGKNPRYDPETVRKASSKLERRSYFRLRNTTEAPLHSFVYDLPLLFGLVSRFTIDSYGFREIASQRGSRLRSSATRACDTAPAYSAGFHISHDCAADIVRLN